MKVVIGLAVNDIKIVPKAGFPLSQWPMKALHKEPSALVLEPIAHRHSYVMSVSNVWSFSSFLRVTVTGLGYDGVQVVERYQRFGGTSLPKFTASRFS
jgi:hypothetical protein